MFLELLREQLQGIWDLSETQEVLLEQHYELLARWNQKLNLTSLRNEPNIVERHYCESIFLASHLPRQAISIADIGSGAGFPGFPVAVLRPDCTVTLIESHQRKAVFLKEASRGLPNVRVAARRAEDVTERFDWAISRAVRYADINQALRRLAGRTALLTGEVTSEELSASEWEPAIQLPWGDRRFLFVSRET